VSLLRIRPPRRVGDRGREMQEPMTEAGPKNNWKYNKRLKTFARKLRNNSTKAEVVLWIRVLRAKQLKGYPFRRQRPILNYIADFMSKDLKLVIEVDGASHNWSHVQEKDARKDVALTAAGFTVLRFTDEQVLEDVDGVIGTLENWIEEFESKSSTPLAPPPAGE